MSGPVISIEGLGKRFLIAHEEERSARTLSDAARAWWRGRSGAREEFWALRGIDIEVKQGERLALVGRNGAGKSTLLKVLSRIMRPDEGSARLRGRVASLLEDLARSRGILPQAADRAFAQLCYDLKSHPIWGRMTTIDLSTEEQASRNAWILSQTRHWVSIFSTH